MKKSIIILQLLFASYLAIASGGSNTFMLQTSTLGGRSISYHYFGDADADGDLDLYSGIGSAPYPVMLFKNNGSGGFDDGTAIPGLNDATFGIGDVNNDGYADIILSCNYTTGVIGKVLINNGSASGLSYTTISGTYLNNTDKNYASGASVVIRDINNDSKNDLIYNSTDQITNKQRTEIWLNTSSGGTVSFAFSQYVTHLQNRSSKDFGDIDGDGDLDMISGGTSNYGEYSINNSGTFSTTTQFVGANYSGTSKLIDWDKDGDLDWVIFDGYNNFGMRWSKNDGTGSFGTFTKLFDHTSIPVVNLNQSNISIVDINNDGFTDAILGSTAGTKVFINSGCGLVLQPYTLGSGSNNYVTSAKLNNDTFPDLVESTGGTTNKVYLNDYSTATTTSTPAPTGSSSQTFCNSAIVTNLSATGTSIKWYASATSTGVLSGASSLTNGSSYFATQTLNTCESNTRLQVGVTINVCLPTVTSTDGNSTIMTAHKVFSVEKTIYVSAEGIEGINVSSVNGNSVYQGTGKIIDLASQSTGLYVVTLISEGRSTKHKVMIQ